MGSNTIKLKTAWIPIVAGILTSMALCVNVAFDPDMTFRGMIINEINGVGITGLVVFAAVMFLYIRSWKIFLQRSKFITHLLAFILSVFMMIGLSYSKLGNWDFIFGNTRQFILACMFFVGFFILFDVCITLLYSIDISKLKGIVSVRPKRIPSFISNHYFLFAFIVIAVCWLPYLILNLPGSVPYDGYRQLNMFFGIEAISNHHPWVLTEFYGLLMTVGRNISDNFGVFLIVIVSYIAQAVCYAKTCETIRSWSAPFLFNAASLAFFAVLPAFGSYSQALMKDGLFSALFTLFFALYIDLCISYIRKKDMGDIRKKLIILFVVEVLVCLTRNNGIYMVIPADILLLFFTAKNKKRILVVVMTVAVAASYLVVENPIASAVGVKDGSIKEMLSVPFQQTARYLNEYPDDVTEEEKDAINGVLSYNTIAEKYIPERSDPVKDTYRSKSSRSDLINYFKAWFTMFLRHPGVYFEATFNNTFGYYYPFYNCKALGAYQYYIQGEPLAKGNLDIHYVVPDNLRGIVIKYSELWNKVPGAAQIMNPGTYTWMLLICIGYLCYKKKIKGNLALLAPFLNILVCIVSPVNGYLRYALPLMGCAPVIIYWCLCYKNRKKNTDGEDSDEPERLEQ